MICKIEMCFLWKEGICIIPLDVTEMRYFTSEKLRAGNEKEEVKVLGRWDVE